VNNEGYEPMTADELDELSDALDAGDDEWLDAQDPWEIIPRLIATVEAQRREGFLSGLNWVAR
jgi:hypothetical protein